MNGLMIETHINPEKALSDANQQVTPLKLKKIMKNLVVRDAKLRDEIFKEQLSGKADRVLMLLPERSDEFLDSALAGIKNKGIIHYYSHIHADRKQDAPKLSEEHFLNVNKTNAEIITSRNVRPVGPRFYQTVVDVKISKN